jgi:hypothetical protein
LDHERQRLAAAILPHQSRPAAAVKRLIDC